MNKIILTIDKINTKIGHAVSWLSLILVLVIIADVFMRYAFNYSSAASFELEWHLFAILFLISAGWTLLEDKHVRVDVFYHRFSPKKKALVNLIGVLLMLLPLCYVGIIEGWKFVANAYAVGETSPDPGGLPARYIVKAMIPIGFILLGLQGISLVLKSILDLRSTTND
jgi:TRAP-type mannitol/chloroaromatic compound transport system permease small subunit